MTDTRRPIREGPNKRGGVKPVPTTPKPNVIPPSQSSPAPPRRRMTRQEHAALHGAFQAHQPSPLTDHTSPPILTWELDIQDEQLEGGDEKLASLIFSSAAGQCRTDNFTPEALRAIADELIDHAHGMDGRDFFSRTTESAEPSTIHHPPEITNP